jgi:hypothetical protein
MVQGKQTERLDMTPQQFAYAVGAMLECALWSSIDGDTDEPMDAEHGIEDIHPTATRTLIAELEDFIEANAADIAASGLDPAQIGHDFWLTRNGHGAGFWDRGLGEVGERLTRQCRPYGEVNLYVGDDGGIYL